MRHGFDVPAGPTVVGIVLAALIVASTGGAGIGPVDAAVSTAQNVTSDVLGVEGAVDERPTVNETSYNESAIERAIHRRINRRRASAGRSRLIWDPLLLQIARFHSDDMARVGYVAHTSPSGRSIADRYEQFGYDCGGTDGNQSTAAGENLARLSVRKPGITEVDIAARVVGNWVNSTSHRRTLLAPRWQQQAVGVSIVRREGRLFVYVTQNLC